MKVSVYAGVTIRWCMQMFMPANARVSESMNKKSITFIYLFTNVSIFETTGYRTVELKDLGSSQRFC